MTATRLVDAVVFDYGGVLTTPVRGSIDAWLAADGIDPASLSRILKSWCSLATSTPPGSARERCGLSRNVSWNTPIHRLETGELSTEEFGRRLTAELTTVDGRSVDPAGVLDRLFAEMRPEPEMFALVEDLRELGIRVGLLPTAGATPTPVNASRPCSTRCSGTSRTPRCARSARCGTGCPRACRPRRA